MLAPHESEVKANHSLVSSAPFCFSFSAYVENRCLVQAAHLSYDILAATHDAIGMILAPSNIKKQNALSPKALSSTRDFHEMKRDASSYALHLLPSFFPEYSYGQSVNQPT